MTNTKDLPKDPCENVNVTPLGVEFTQDFPTPGYSPTRELTRAIMSQPRADRRRRPDRRELPERLAFVNSRVLELRAHSHELSCWLTQVRIEYQNACTEFQEAQKELKKLLSEQAELNGRVVKVREHQLKDAQNSSTEANYELSPAAMLELVKATKPTDAAEMLRLLQAKLAEGDVK